MDDEKRMDEVQTENVSSKPTSNFKFSSKLVFAIFILLVIASFALVSRLKFTVPTPEPDYLAVTYVSPKGETNSTKPKIVISFNLPVEAHHAAEYFYISPFVKGQLLQGSISQQIVYELEETFPVGASVSVTLKAGLPSESGKKLLNDYTFNFNIKHDAQSITFTKGNLAGKFMSFQQSMGTDIALKIGSGFNDAKVRVYEASLPQLLQSFSYIKTTNYGNPTEGEYQEKMVDTKNLKLAEEYKDVKDGDKINFKGKTGLYIFQAYEGETVMNTAWVTLNETGIHLRQDDQNVYLAAQNLKTGEPDNSIGISFYELHDSPKLLVKHTLSGIQEYPFTHPQRLDLVVGQKGEDIMVIPVAIPNTQAEIRLYQNLNNKHQLFLYTDRPVYRAGATVSFRGLVRTDNDALYELPNVKRVRVFSGDNKVGFDKEVEVSEGGVFYGDFKLPTNFSGEYVPIAVTTELSKDKYSYNNGTSTYFTVFEYVKPEFGLEVEVDKSEYTKPDIIKAKVIGKYFNGNPYSNQKIKLTMYTRDYYETEKAVYNSSFNLNGWGGMCGGGFSDEYYGEIIGETRELELNVNGETTIDFSTNELKSLLSQEVTFVAEKIDANNNKIIAAKNAIVHQGQFNIFFRPGPSRLAYDEEFNLVFYSEDLAGNKLSDKEFVYEIYETIWSGQDRSQKKIIKTGNIRTDTNGTGIVKETLPKQDKETYMDISIRSKDKLDNEVEAMKRISFYDGTSGDSYRDWFSSISQTILKITSTTGSVKVGDTANLEIIAPNDMKVFLAFERGRSYSPRWIDLKKGSNNFSFQVMPEHAPSITPTFSFFHNGEYFIEGLSLNVPALHKVLSIDVATDKEKYNTGDTSVVTITTKDSEGNLVASDVGVGIVDKAIYALRKNAAPPLHSSFYFFRGRSLNTSSSLTWIATYDWGGGGGGGGGGNLFQKDSDTLYWNPRLKTGTDGQVKIEVPIGDTQTTWQILVYASTADTKLGQTTKEFLVSN